MTRGIEPLEAILRSWRALIASWDPVPGAAHVFGPDVIYGTTGIAVPQLNAVLGARFLDTSADARIASITAWFRSRSMPFTWWVDPGDRPADLGARLQAHGCVEAGTIPGMYVELDRLPDIAAPPGLSIHRVTDLKGFQRANEVAGEAFGMPDEILEGLGRASVLGFADEAPSRTFLAELEGRPVATALGVMGEGVVGIFNVGTVPDARGRGIGRAITAAVMHDGSGRGASVAVLESSDMGHAVYERLGFRDVTTFRLYVGGLA